MEITEDALLTDPNAAREVTHQLQEIGATLALDDFGSGYSSLSQLQQISPRSVKIDRRAEHASGKGLFGIGQHAPGHIPSYRILRFIPNSARPAHKHRRTMETGTACARFSLP